MNGKRDNRRFWGNIVTGNRKKPKYYLTKKRKAHFQRVAVTRSILESLGK